MYDRVGERLDARRWARYGQEDSLACGSVGGSPQDARRAPTNAETDAITPQLLQLVARVPGGPAPAVGSRLMNRRCGE